MRRRRPTVTKKTEERRKRPAWLSVLIVVAITGMLFVSINFRSYTAMRGELRENEQLTEKIENLTDENLQLQDEIHSLKTDRSVVQREAKRLGIPVGSLPADAKTQFSVPVK